MITTFLTNAKNIERNHKNHKINCICPFDDNLCQNKNNEKSFYNIICLFNYITLLNIINSINIYNINL